MSVDQVRSPRRTQILHEAAQLFAARGFHGVSVDEIGAASGITGPGLYRHFRGKDAMLAELLVGISEQLLREARRRVAEHAEPDAQLDALVRGHIDFALNDRALIVLHDRDLANLRDEEQRTVRRLQRAYVEIWVAVVVRAYPGFTRSTGPETAPFQALAAPDDGEEAVPPSADARARAAVHAVFGLLNSTPHSASSHRGPRAPGPDVMAELLRTLALGAFAAAGG
ncbi:TetR/AcrR family transcriptional regulator [Yinghuangia sp. ASG 101]|uniref:TetR/AcrR family transcriptional regulator n=1 Tax=Yinghuangia sp. ASG 101 TaxID=2896848 RepID=UPI001E2D86A0|nr:TetR/AcrR family transcriptional regulator [Yinghuangia sp. ASG 101]UGQ13638.1 TetR/AcrR family transcriptional regulator [Yinghuangia sp. ASG 101]